MDYLYVLLLDSRWTATMDAIAYTLRATNKR
jgi:hypothetical protein